MCGVPIQTVIHCASLWASKKRLSLSEAEKYGLDQNINEWMCVSLTKMNIDTPTSQIDVNDPIIHQETGPNSARNGNSHTHINRSDIPEFIERFVCESLGLVFNEIVPPIISPLDEEPCVVSDVSEQLTVEGNDQTSINITNNQIESRSPQNLTMMEVLQLASTEKSSFVPSKTRKDAKKDDERVNMHGSAHTKEENDWMSLIQAEGISTSVSGNGNSDESCESGAADRADADIDASENEDNDDSDDEVADDDDILSLLDNDVAVHLDNTSENEGIMSSKAGNTPDVPEPLIPGVNCMALPFSIDSPNTGPATAVGNHNTSTSVLDSLRALVNKQERRLLSQIPERDTGNSTGSTQLQGKTNAWENLPAAGKFVIPKLSSEQRDIRDNLGSSASSNILHGREISSLLLEASQQRRATEERALATSDNTSGAQGESSDSKTACENNNGENGKQDHTLGSNMEEATVTAEMHRLHAAVERFNKHGPLRDVPMSIVHALEKSIRNNGIPDEYNPENSVHLTNALDSTVEPSGSDKFTENSVAEPVTAANTDEHGLTSEEIDPLSPRTDDTGSLGREDAVLVKELSVVIDNEEMYDMEGFESLIGMKVSEDMGDSLDVVDMVLRSATGGHMVNSFSDYRENHGEEFPDSEIDIPICAEEVSDMMVTMDVDEDDGNFDPHRLISPVLVSSRVIETANLAPIEQSTPSADDHEGIPAESVANSDSDTQNELLNVLDSLLGWGEEEEDDKDKDMDEKEAEEEKASTTTPMTVRDLRAASEKAGVHVRDHHLNSAAADGRMGQQDGEKHGEDLVAGENDGILELGTHYGNSENQVRKMKYGQAQSWAKKTEDPEFIMRKNLGILENSFSDDEDDEVQENNDVNVDFDALWNEEL